MRTTKFFRCFGVMFLAAIFGILLCPPPAFSANIPQLRSSLVNKIKQRFLQHDFKATQNGNVVGGLTGNFSVTPRGQAHYSIPLDVPPGTNKMTPALALTYDSTSSNLRNGLLGMGFALEGITAITRCPSNKTQNGIIHGVDFSDQDRFCLNGEQLVAIHGGYGQDGTEYRTYNDTQARIISHGRQGNGPAYFTVETKGGQNALYGATSDSQVKAQGKDTVAFWSLNRIKDTLGNYLDVRYFRDEGQGSFYPTEINYTGNERTGMPTYNQVKMLYEGRADTRTTWQAGSKTTVDKRLSEIQIFAEGTLVSAYKLTYEISPNTYRSRITSIQKCSGDGQCLPPTKLQWQVNEEGWEKVDNYKLPENLYVDGDTVGQLVDLNSDGLPDFVQANWRGGRGETKGTWLNTGSGWVKAFDAYKLPENLYVDGDTVGQLVDLNGDGLPDFVQANWRGGRGETKGTWLNNGSGWVKADNFTLPENLYVDGDTVGQLVDLNGDGLPDFVQANWRGGRGETKNTWLNKAKKFPDYLIGITDGLGSKTKIDYESLSSPKVNVYTKEHDAKYPNMDWQGPMYVVYQTVSNANISDPKALARIETENSAANAQNHTTTYHYTGAKFNHLGLGFLGFHQVSIKDESTGITKTITYGQDYIQHNIGHELSTETRLRNNNLIHVTHNQWQTKTFGDGSPNHSYYLTLARQVMENSYDLNSGKLLSTKTITTDFDDYANAIHISNVITDNHNISFSTNTQNTYRTIIDNNHWYPGQLMRSEVTAVAPNTNDEKHVSAFDYDDHGSLITEITEPDDQQFTLTKSYQYDDYGNVKRVATFNLDKTIDQVVTNEYDNKARFVVKTTNPLGQSITQNIDPRFGVPKSITDANQLTTNYRYDSFGRTLGQANPDGSSVTKEYLWTQNPPADALGAIYVEVTHTSGHPEALQYFDELNRSIAKATLGFDGRTVWQTMQYDELDRTTRMSLPYFAGEKPLYVLNDYDYLGRVIQTTKPDGSFITFVYDGFTTRTINAIGQGITKTVNVRGNLIESIDHTRKAVHYRYDAYGRLLAIIDSKGNTTSMTYDKLGHKLSQSDPDKGTWSYAYDVLGELLKQTDAIGNITRFEYDALGRMTKRIDGKGQSQWIYGNDPIQRNVGLLIHEDGVANKNDARMVIEAKRNGIQNYSKDLSYDQYARPYITTFNLNGADYITKVAYDDLGRVAKTTYPNGTIVENVYDGNLGYLTTIRDGVTKKAYWQVNAMDAAGRIIAETRSNGLITTHTYDPLTGFVTNIATQKGSAVLVQEKFDGKTPNMSGLQDLKYKYDKIGNVLARDDSVNQIQEQFNYDDLNRLTSWQAKGAITRAKIYQYDELGNITYQSGLGSYIYGGTGPHAVSQVTGDDGSTVGRFIYDKDGNQTYAFLNGKERIINYTSYEKPLSIISDNAQVEFYYNATRIQFERVDRVKENGKLITTTTLSLPSYDLESRDDGSSIRTREKVYVGPYAEVITEHTGSATRTDIYEFLKDYLGSVTGIIDSYGNVIQSYAYEPFGKQIALKSMSEDVLTHEGFAGHQTVESFDLIHMNGRIYDPVLARFLSADPTIQSPDNLQDLNKYSYCLNNPLHYVDPTGFGWFDWLGDLIHDIGHIIGDVIHEVGKAIGSILENRYFQMAAGIAMSFIPGLQGFGLALAEGAYAAFNTALAGGGIGDMLKSGAMAFVGSEFGSWMNAKEFSKTAFGTEKWVEGVALRGIEGGGMRIAEGGSFTDGFLYGAVTQAVQAPIAKINESDFRISGMLVRSAATGIVGGSMAAMTGGNFGEAFKTSAFQHLCAEDFSLTMKPGQGVTRVSDVKSELDRKGIAMPIARPFLDIPILNKIPFLYPLMHTATYYNGHAMGLEPKAGTGIDNFSGEAHIYDDSANLDKYVVLNIPGYENGFDAERMQNIVEQQATTWDAANSASAARYNLLLNNCHDLTYDAIHKYAMGF